MSRFAVQGGYVIKTGNDVLKDHYVIVEDSTVAGFSLNCPRTSLR